MKKRLAILLLLLIWLPGCSRGSKERSISSHVASSITVTSYTSRGTLRRHYTSEEKMHKILLYIRGLSPMFKAQQEPQEPIAWCTCILVTCEDGSRKLYRQVGDRFFQTGKGPWQQLPYPKGSELRRLLLTIPADKEDSRSYVPSLPRLPEYEAFPRGIPLGNFPDK